MQQQNIAEITFNQILEEWLLYKKPKIKESTFLNYKFLIEKYLKGTFKDKNLEFFKEYDLNKYIENLIIRQRKAV